MKSNLLAVSLTALVVACSPPADKTNTNTFTFWSGITLENYQEYDDSEWIEGKLSLKRVDNDYLVTVVSYFSCGTLAKPYLIDREKNLTLVIQSQDGGCSEGCECGRSLTIRISGRAKPGDMLYVVNEREVLGHFVVP